MKEQWKLEEGLEPNEGKGKQRKSKGFCDELVKAESKLPDGAEETNNTEAFIFTNSQLKQTDHFNDADISNALWHTEAEGPSEGW